jgi:hypothetical protein
VSGLGGGGHPVPGQAQVVDRLGQAGGVIFDRRAGQARFDGQPDGLGDPLRVVGEGVLQVG